MPARAYPYERWPRVGRADALLLRRVLRALPWPDRHVVDEAETLLGARLRVSPGTAELWDAQTTRAALPSPLLVLWLEHARGARSLPLVCELAVELGAALVDRVLGGDGRPAHAIGQSLDDLSAGVLGYLAARLVAAAGAELRVRAVLGDLDRAQALLGQERVLVWPVALELGFAPAGRVRIFVPEASVRELAAHEVSRPALTAAVRGLPLALCAHAATVTLKRAELEALTPGDVVVPERCRLAHAADGWHGEVELHAIGSHRDGVHCTARGNQLTVQTPRTPGKSIMTEAKRIETQVLDTGTLGLAGDAPVSLCLELARFTLSLDELSALRPGEVLSTGRPIGEQATLCAAGRPIARGELVDIEGEVGLRVLELVR